MTDAEYIYNPIQNPQDQSPTVQKKVLRRQPASDDEIIIQESSCEGDKLGFSVFDCGCDKPSWMLTKNDGEIFESWSGKCPCKLHVRYCFHCGDTLCISGDADGLKLVHKGRLYWFCPDCYQLAVKEIRSTNFWEGLKKGFFGGEKDEKPAATVSRATTAKAQTRQYRPSPTVGVDQKNRP